jgi:hypothetical protein
MLRQAPFDKIGQIPTPKYTNANPTSGDPGSIPNAETFNQLQFEGENLVALGGLTADGANLFQWTQAVSRGGIWADQLTGTGDLAVATLPIPNNGAVLPALLKGMRVAGIATASNTVTNPKLRVMNVGTSAGLYADFSIIKQDGSALAAGDIKAGRIYRYEADGAGNVMVSGGGLSSVPAGEIRAIALNTTRVTFTTPGSFSYTVPTGVTRVRLKGWGAGGGGGGAASGSPGGAASGGGSGAYFEKSVAVSPGDTITGTIGAGGSAGTAGANGGTGSNTTIVVGGTTYTIPAGAGGASANAGIAQNSVSGGALPSGGEDTSHIGAVSAQGTFSNNGSPLALGGVGGSAPYGGFGGNAGPGNGNPGSAPGGGGGGGGGSSGSVAAGGAGAAGAVWIES